jgi:hypothetical protein
VAVFAIISVGIGISVSVGSAVGSLALVRAQPASSAAQSIRSNKALDNFRVFMQPILPHARRLSHPSIYELKFPQIRKATSKAV